jgi:adenine deaminase
MTANIVDIYNQKIYWGTLSFENNAIKSIENLGAEKPNEPYILPGFIDAHIHIESSMVLPAAFAKTAVLHGTVATISDPHEIANVCGMEGVKYMIENGTKVNFNFHFGAPSCVPATCFETAGAVLSTADVTELLLRDDIFYLSEMMNFPGVLFDDADVLAKIEAAKKIGKPIDGHAPGLRGEQAKKYINAGITTDHECFTYDEAKEKLDLGMKILIREGSAAKNFEALIPLLNDYPNDIMFCSDDKHPDNLMVGHINDICKRAVAKGVSLWNVLQAACINPILHYKMKVGTLQLNDKADFIIVKNLETFDVLQTYINGKLVADNKISFIEDVISEPINNFNANKINQLDLIVNYNNEKEIAVIEALEGQLITNRLNLAPKVEDNKIVSDVENDVLKMVVVNRYFDAPIAKCFIKNIGLKLGAFASTVAHDSHNIIAVGVDDESLTTAINAIIANKGGLSVYENNDITVLPLSVAGLMSLEPVAKVAEKYEVLDAKVKAMGSNLNAPFMTLSFMALLVIPSLKLSDKGLFDGNKFEFVL